MFTLSFKLNSDVVGSRNVSGKKVLDLRDVHGLFDGGVSAADVKKAALQRVVADHHGEKYSHLIIPEIQHTHTHTHVSPLQETHGSDNCFSFHYNSELHLLCVQLLRRL